jgi:hypothetical protein
MTAPYNPPNAIGVAMMKGDKGDPGDPALMLTPYASLDFTKLPDGPLPAVDDNGHQTTVSTNQGVPTISKGKYVANPTSDTGNFADYTHIYLGGGDGKRIGCEFTVAQNDGGVASLCIALWDRTFPNPPNPKGRVHATIVPGSGANGLCTWVFWILDGAGHVITVSSGQFKALAYDDSTIWRYDIEIDEERGDAYLLLPDNSIAVVTAAQVAAATAATSGWAAGSTLKSLSGTYAMIEHFANSGALTNKNGFPRFTRFYAEVDIPGKHTRLASLRSVLQLIRANLTPDTGWTAPTLVNGWVLTAGQEPAGFRKLANGVVEVRGYLTGGTASTTAFVLPAGYRPSWPIYKPIVGTAGLVTCSVDGLGNVVIAATAGGWVNFSFDTTP